MAEDQVKIITNNVPRDVLYGWDLTLDERAEFDYIDWHSVEHGEASPEFFRYKGQLYDLNDGFETTSRLLGDPTIREAFAKWDGYQSDSFFSGLVIRFVDDFEAVVVGRYMV